MWFADLVCDLDWFVDCRGDLGQPRLRHSVPSSGEIGSVRMCVYGSDLVVHHVRIMIEVDSYERASGCVNQNIQYWIRLLEVSTGLLAEATSTAYVLPGTHAFMVILGEGDEHSSAVQIQPKRREPVNLNYEALGRCLSNWRPDCATHLFYLGRFLNEQLPLDARWLNGYRLIEWHFQKGIDGVSKNPKWRALLSEFETELKPHLKPRQTFHGFFEETRAMVAHAILDSRPEDERLRKPGDAVQWSFGALEKMVIRICNDARVRMGDLLLQPRPNPGVQPTPRSGRG